MRRASPAETLLSIALEAPVTEGPRATVTFLLDQLSALFPGMAVGLCVVSGDESPWIDRRMPPGFLGWLLPTPDERFGKLPGERIFELDEVGSSLHFAETETLLRAEPARSAARSSREERSDEASPYVLAARVAARCLALSRASGRPPLDARDRLDDALVPESQDVNALVRGALSSCEQELARLSIRLETQLDESLPRVRGFSGQLTQVFVNLITNAAHAAAEGGRRVKLRTRAEGRWVVALVSDDGLGIKNEHLDRIFEPFFTTKPVGQGTGLGLSIVRDIVDQHAGVLSVETRPGSGATFVVRLPLV